MDDKIALRRRDFWTALALISVSLFMLLQTTAIPFFKAQAAGISDGKWYNSAAIVPYLVFGLLLAFSVSLLIIAIRQGGLPRKSDFAEVPALLGSPAIIRFGIICMMLLGYIFALVPRVDFIFSTALTMMALSYGFHQQRMRPAVIGLVAILVPSIYALAVNFPPDLWAKPHDDDYATLLAFVALVVAALAETRMTRGKVPLVLRLLPIICFVTPLLLVTAMAFGFRQNVPNRTGLLFSQIEYHYYVTIKPLFAARKG